MKKIFQLIVSIPHDKLLHIIAGMIVVMLVLRLVSFIGIPGMIARIIALIAVILPGYCVRFTTKNTEAYLIKKICAPQFPED